MPRNDKERTLAEVESNQAALRENIEMSKDLIAESDRLLDRYRADHDAAEPERKTAAKH